VQTEDAGSDPSSRARPPDVMKPAADLRINC